MLRFTLLVVAAIAIAPAQADELEDVNTAVGLCLGDRTAAFDDGISDASTIADAVIGACIAESERAAAVIYERVKATEGVEFEVFKLQIHSFHRNFALQRILERRARKRQR